MGRIQEARSGPGAQIVDAPHPLRRAKPVRPCRNGEAGLYLQEHRALMGEVIDVAAGLVFRDGKLLITRRFDDAHLGGLWEFPGGKREPEETFEACLARELREELAI